ncbi:hypothetical protein Ga0100231_022835 [Opitutaceae bacterium TAV4]|nr:hypothetical protein Ga0100231_022835 [Opitutaceae bacterium TAV4]RRK00687.1 hypothetical protein Ga0100230_023090 [Opitutaceae bacterium TAV3]
MKRVLITALAGVFAVAAYAQQSQATVSTNNDSASVFGKRYVGADWTYYDINGQGSAYQLGATFNQPVHENVDAYASYSYGWVGGHTSHDSQQLSVGANVYFDIGNNIRPFAGVGIGYAWGSENNDDWFYTGRVGGEITLLQNLSLLAYAAYTDGGKNYGIDDIWTATAQATYWLTEKLALVGRATYFEEGDWAYAIGALFRF